MGRVVDWIDEWKTYHASRVAPPIGGWPPETAPFWRTFRDMLIDAKASQETANAASDANAATPAKAQADTVQAYRAALNSVISTKGASGGMSRDEAHAASQSLARDQYGDPMPCEVCGGEGIGQFRRADGEEFEVKTAAGLRRRMAELPMACPVCPMGRWMAAHNKTLPDAQLYGDRVMTRLDYFVPAEVDEPRDVRAELRAGINREFSPARAG